ncbi:MAG: ThiF family adenylyltransferase [Syntrophobacteraceae bacterium]
MQSMHDRYARQLILPEIGPKGQQSLADSTVLILGCGALGGFQAEMLARAGVGILRIVDRDFVEWNNLHRQILFDENDAAENRTKVEAAARRLTAVNSTVVIEPLALDVNPRNIETLLTGVSLILDGTDNFETRYLINDVCVKHGIPWVYGGVIGAVGMMMPISPGEGPCLRCLVPTPPEPGGSPTCDTNGVLNTAVAVIASYQATVAIRLLVGSGHPEIRLLHFNPWQQSFESFKIERNPDCPCCALKEYEFLNADKFSWTTVLCGRSSVQVTPPHHVALDLPALSERLARAGRVSYSGLLLRFEAPDGRMVIFPDGRAIVSDTTDETKAGSLYAKYIGT